MGFQVALTSLLEEFSDQLPELKNKLFVVGASTSEVVGGKIGKQGSVEIAQELYAALRQFEKKTGVHLVFQCCEHLNRAIVIERRLAEEKGLPEVAAIPVREAGGAMAAYAFNQMGDPVLVERISCDLGIDIGDTFIGMHLKEVAIPIRLSKKELGQAHVTFASTRPKRIGGERAVYKISE
ncbi:TIGR01440 family protein [Bacillus sp. JCM 19041]|uniref:TIGR01440 family protein n=1 Tax=Bacillus sp. JCM 19041 TaxID=1460637 RepID=UPI0006CFB265